MKVGDLVLFGPKPPPGMRAGSLTAAKYFARTQQRINGRVGVIVTDLGDNCAVMFGEDIIIINKNFLEVIDNDETGTSERVI